MPDELATFTTIKKRVWARIPKWCKVVSAIGGGALLLLIIWGAGIEPRLIDERHETARVPGLPPAWEGRQVAFISDLQVGMWLGNTDTVRRIVARIVKQRPSAVLFGGDFIYHPLEDEPEEVREEYEPAEFRSETLDELDKALELLRPLLEAGIPTYAVLGNHDYGIKTAATPALPWLAREVSEALEKAGIPVLSNRAVAMKSPDGVATPDETEPALYLVGLDSRLAHRDRPAQAVSELLPETPRLVVMHNPDSFAELPAGTAPAAFAGHTHGGQLRIPFYRIGPSGGSSGKKRCIWTDGSRTTASPAIGSTSIAASDSANCPSA